MHVVNVSGFQSLEDFAAADPNHIYVGRPSPLGNPFRCDRKASAKKRAEVVEKYRAWLWEKIKARDPRVIDALNNLRPEHILGCWCKPKSCHADVIVKCFEWMQENPDALK